MQTEQNLKLLFLPNPILISFSSFSPQKKFSSYKIIFFFKKFIIEKYIPNKNIHKTSLLLYAVGYCRRYRSGYIFPPSYKIFASFQKIDGFFKDKKYIALLYGKYIFRGIVRFLLFIRNLVEK